MNALRIDVLICTFRRPEIVDALQSLARLRLPDQVSLRVIVADNDDTPSARSRVHVAARDVPHELVYLHAPARNISIARNACLDAATGDWVAFLDDDEVADPDWLVQMLARAEATGVDGLFGPAIAEYGRDAPDWMRAQDYHSNIPERRGSLVETGHTCNAFLRWAGTPWQSERFELARGRSGGEDTEFFFRLGRCGARFEIAPDAIVREPVAPSRQTYSWLRRRKYRMGQSYASAAANRAARLKLGLTAFGKATFCGIAALATWRVTSRRNFWALRGTLHIGVCAGCLSLRQRDHYG